MDRITIIEAIRNRWTTLGIPFRTGIGADLTIDTTFLDAGWGTGTKKIVYEASVLVDDRAQTVYMFEKTNESGSGFSFGSGSDSSFQSGTTLFRKVKSIQYGPEGKVLEISLDLGAIPKAVKESAKEAGYGFRTALNRDKARYPDEVVPASPPPPTPTPKPSTPVPTPASSAADSNQPFDGIRFCIGCGRAVGPADRFCKGCGARIRT